MRKLILIAVLSCLLQSCSWWQALNITKEVVEHYPSDNYIEDNLVEPFLEDKFDLQPGSLDISPFSPEE